jgi:hypothetical protein
MLDDEGKRPRSWKPTSGYMEGLVQLEAFDVAPSGCGREPDLIAPVRDANQFVSLGEPGRSECCDHNNRRAAPA